MKKTLVFIAMVLVVIGLVFLTMFILPQYLRVEYKIATMPDKTEYRLTGEVGNDGGTYLIVEDWDLAGLVINKSRGGNKTEVVEANQYKAYYPKITQSGNYYIEIILHGGGKILLPIRVLE